MAGLVCLVVGLGRMGAGIAYRLAQAGIQVIGYDPSTVVTIQANFTQVKTLADGVEQADVVWLMVPAGAPVDAVINEIRELNQNLDARDFSLRSGVVGCHSGPGAGIQVSNLMDPRSESGMTITEEQAPDLRQGFGEAQQSKRSENLIIVDGGNSNAHDTIRRAAELKKNNITFVDCGTSGGVDGKELGYCLMVGCSPETFKTLTPLLRAIAAPNGYCNTGPVGSGHLVKTIHNGIEYGLLQAYAEGYAILAQQNVVDKLDLEAITHVWQHGSIIRSWINQLGHDVFSAHHDFAQISGAIGENKTGQWALDHAREAGIEFKTLDVALKTRAESRTTGGNLATKFIALLRNRFGGHPLG